MTSPSPLVDAIGKDQEPVRDQTVVVTVPAGSRLETLLCIWEITKAKLDAQESSYDEIKDGILAELRAMHPEKNIKVYDIPGGPMWPALTYGYQETPYLPAPKIREHLPPVYEAFKQMKKSWTLRKKGKRS